MANKTLKKRLHLGALAAINHDPQIKEYYQRKVAEGKSKMLVINNVRNKLIHRVCAVNHHVVVPLLLQSEGVVI